MKQTPPIKSGRVVSVDALRGFDMFWIVGAGSLVDALHGLSDAKPIQILAEQLEHVAWDGFHFYDLIFPLFVFLTGVSTVFSLDRIRESKGAWAAYRRVVLRGLILMGLGIFYYGALQRGNGPEQYRFVGVLQRIGFAYMIGGILYLNLRTRGLVVACVVILVTYWALLTFVPVPGIGAGNFEPGKNLTNYVDSQFLPGYKWDGEWDPEGLLSNLPAVASGLLGIFAGLIIRRPQILPYQKVGRMLVLGIAGILLGYLWGLQFPVNKKLWSSSFVLYAGGWSYLLLALFYLTIDIWKFDLWARPFVWIGLNPLTIYLVGNLIGGYSNIVRRVIHRPAVEAMGAYGNLIVAIIGLCVVFGFSLWLHRRNIYIRI